MTQQIQSPDKMLIASTPEGCEISRDKELGFIVACGEGRRAQRHVPTLSAAYAICQQLMPRQPASARTWEQVKPPPTATAAE